LGDLAAYGDTDQDAVVHVTDLAGERAARFQSCALLVPGIGRAPIQLAALAGGLGTRPPAREEGRRRTYFNGLLVLGLLGFS
jgi:hypothetical protein